MIKKAITLIELLIALVLFLVIIMGAVSFDLAGRRFLRSSERKTEVLNDLTFILEHLFKNVSLATGDINSEGIKVPDGDHLRVRLDLNSPPTPSDYSDDLWIEYRINGNNLEFCSDFNITNSTCRVNYEIISSRLIPDISPAASFSKRYPNQAVISNLRLRYNPLIPSDPAENPEVSIIDVAGTLEVVFTSLSYSIN